MQAWGLSKKAKIGHIVSLLPKEKVGQTTIDAYADLLETDYFFMFPSDFEETLKIIPKKVKES